MDRQPDLFDNLSNRWKEAFMRGSGEHVGGDIGVLVAAVWLVVAGAWIAQAGRFSIALALLATGALAVTAATVAIHYESRRH